MKNLTLQFKVASDFGYLPFLTRLFSDWPDGQAFRLRQILAEAFNNAVCHAHKKQKRKWITIAIHKERQKTVLRVWDRGPGLCTQNCGRRGGLWATRGRGLALIGALADSLRSFKKPEGHCLEAVCYEEKRTD